jgi:hypothetical protein
MTPVSDVSDDPSTVPITVPSFDETSELTLSVAVVDMRRVLRARETTVRGVYPSGGIGDLWARLLTTYFQTNLTKLPYFPAYKMHWGKSRTPNFLVNSQTKTHLRKRCSQAKHCISIHACT